MNGIFLVDKDAQMTSHDVVYKIKKKFNLDKVGHAGTLDPFATGLLIILVGKATRLSSLLSSHHKTYEGVIEFGKYYDTYDTTGKVIDELPINFSKSDVEKATQSFIPSYMQKPPIYSALKIDGIRAYKHARSGNFIELEPRFVEIFDFQMTSFNDDHISFKASVSSGTYIRSLAFDLGEKLNTYGALKSLRRISIDNFDIKDAKSLDDITIEDFIDHKTLFKHYPKITLNDYLITLVKNGVRLDERQTTLTEPFIVENEQGEYIALYEPSGEGTYKISYLF